MNKIRVKLEGGNNFKDKIIEKGMAIRFGPIDPLQLIFEIMNSLVNRGLITLEEGDIMIKNSLDPSLSEEEKQKIVNSLRGKDKDDKAKI